MKKFFLFSLFILILVIAVGAGGYMLGLKQASETAKKAAFLPPSSPTPTPSTSNDSDISTNQNPPPQPTEITLSAVIPSSWKTIQDTTGSYQLSYNPVLFTASAGEGILTFTYNDGSQKGVAYIFTRKPYNGGSRHAFITEYLGENYTTGKTYEKSYSVDGKSALILYHISSAATTLAGMVPLNSASALLITGTDTKETDIQGILQTLKVLK